ncbi:MAG TPA: hypothetical protein DHW82_07655 [Spirochaetia bacterium]|nr:MAG: hypothetical protein A2Y41_02350 [Spirochaetes bacterium GWB1_36_13]HCL56869.1 hypothetical protein [Spirochaetia bacterium]
MNLKKNYQRIRDLMKQNKFFLLLFLLPLSIFPNDSWYTSLKTSGGSIYSETEHPSVQMKKEALFFHPFQNHLLCRVNYLFHNDSQEEVQVKTGFPVIFFSDFSYDKDLIFLFYYPARFGKNPKKNL